MNLFKKFLGLILTIALLSTIFILWFQRQNIYDWLRLQSYTPPQGVVALADSTTMTDKSRRLFYVNRPVIATATEFNEVCSKETSIVLGCYISNQGIYIYNVTDPRLEGVKEVTAAHEMLHAAYERLSTKERERIDALTAQTYSELPAGRVRENVELYRQQDASVVPNELHSILPTEVRNLPPELEQYYQKYFRNRNVIVEFAERYEAEFDSRRAQVANYDQQLESLKQQIQDSKDSLAADYNQLQASKNQLDSLRASGQIDEYNAGVPDFNAQVVSYNASVRGADALINEYNSIVEKRNNLSVDIQNLAEAIDSRPQSF